MDQEPQKRKQHPRDIQVGHFSDRIRKELDSISDIPNIFLHHVDTTGLEDRVKGLLAVKGLQCPEEERFIKTIDSMMVFGLGVTCHFCEVEFEPHSDQLYIWFTDKYISYACIDRDKCESICLAT